MDLNDKKLRFIIVADDRTVYVNGDPRVLDPDVVIPPEIHAIQWYGTWGEIEFKPVTDDVGNVKQEPNERFFDPQRFKEWFDGHANAVARDEKLREEHAKGQAMRELQRKKDIAGGQKA